MPRSFAQRLADAGAPSELVEVISVLVAETSMTVAEVKNTFSDDELNEIQDLIDAMEDNSENLESRKAALDRLRQLLPGDSADGLAPDEVKNG